MEWSTKMEGGGTLFVRDDGAYVYLEATRPADESGLHKVVIFGLRGKQVLGTLSPSDGQLKLKRMVSSDTLAKWGCWPINRVVCQLTFPFQGEETPGHLEEIVPDGSENLEEEPEFLPVVSLEREEEEAIFSERETAPREKFSPKEEGWEEEFLPVESVRKFVPYHPWKHRVAPPQLSAPLSRLSGVLWRWDGEGGELAVPYFPGKEFPLTPLFCLGRFQEVEGGKYLCFSFDGGGKPCFHRNKEE